MVFKDRIVKKEMVKTKSLSEKTRGEDIFQNYFTNCPEKNVSIPMCVSIDTEDPPPLTMENFNFSSGR